MGVPVKVQFAVAEKFWAFITQIDKFPETRTGLSEVYTAFRINLSDQIERKVNFSSVLFSLRKIGVIKWARRKDKETVIYNPEGRKVPVSENLTEKFQAMNIAAIGGFAQLGGKLKRLVGNKDLLSQNRGNVVILPESENGVVVLDSANVGEEREVIFIVTNETENRRYLFGSVVLGTTSEFNIDNAQYEFMGKDFGNMSELRGQQIATIPVTIKEPSPGIFLVTVAFWFRSGRGDPFHIVKFMKIEFKDDIVVDLEPTEPYKKIDLLKFAPDVELVKGEPLTLKTPDYKVTLKRYRVPQELRRYGKFNQHIYLWTFIKQGTPVSEHCQRLATLLHIEELQMEEDIQRYNMEAAILEPVRDGCLALEVPGLLENRPSVLRGDRLFVRKVKRDGTYEKKEYEGYVHHVERDAVHLKFNSRFHRSFVKNQKFGVRFSFRRTTFRIMHRALEQAPKYLKSIPHPNSWQCVPQSVPVTPLRFYNVNVSRNEEQKQAVEKIVAGTSRPYPYLVFGPPGTGKTVTMVEAINQILYKYPNSRILACAPSNSAADLLLERVAKQQVVPGDKMARLNAMGRAKASVNPEILKHCKIEGDFFYLPPREEIVRYRLVVTTLITAGRLVSLGIGKSHFTHVFVDEAGQGMEPETLVPIAGLLSKNVKDSGQTVVLAGDPKQLGPVLRSRLAFSVVDPETNHQYGLGISFLERLMDKTPKFLNYNRRNDGNDNPPGPYNTNMVTKLLKNYRSHPDIIKVPNELFYDDEIQACADVIARESLCQWEGLPNKGFPVVFEGVKGDEKREEKSPSYFNPCEVSAVLRYVRMLKEKRGQRVEDKDIGIISPYHRQVVKIREQLQKKPYNTRDIKVGSVEEFQGQERRVIIISTVRTDLEFFYLESEKNLGFLKNPKRFNVAITRAKALLVIIGHPYVLVKDKHWRKFISFCVDNGAYTGVAFEMPDIEENTIANQLDQLELNGDTSAVPNAANEEEEPEWRPPEA